MTPLTAAVRTGNIAMCKFLLDKGADVNVGDIVSKTVCLSVRGCGELGIKWWFVCVFM